MKIAVDASYADTPVAGRIEAGDRVYVWGDLEVGDNGDSRFEADGVVELTADADADGATATERDAPAAAPEAS